MSRDDFVIVEEREPDLFDVYYGFGEDEGRRIAKAMSLRQAILEAQKTEAEYGISFRFLVRATVGETGTGLGT